jgi:transposase
VPASCGPGPRSHSLVGYRAEPLFGSSYMCWEAPVFTERTSVGLDVHARSVVAAAVDGVTGEVFRARLTPGSEDVLGWVRSLPGPSAVVYEAGPTGFGLSRALTAAGVRCEVVAPSKIQRPAGDRVKTDARDAMHLARLLRLDEVVSVAVPSVAREAARDLVRAREDVRGDLMRARHRVSNLLLRQGVVYCGGRAWTGTHLVWLRRQHFDTPGLQLAFDASHEAVLQAEARRDRLDKAIEAMAADSEFTPVVHRLGCLRGVATLTSFGLAVEIGDWQRLTGASIGAYLGLVPTESSSGTSRSQGSITKTGNTHARRLLVEAAWHHRKPYRTPGATMRARWELAPAPARARGHAGNQRLHQRWLHFTDRRKKPVIANVAIARELAGWCWSLAVMDD